MLLVTSGGRDDSMHQLPKWLRVHVLLTWTFLCTDSGVHLITSFLRVYARLPPNGISIDSAVFARLTVVIFRIDTQTQIQTRWES